MTYSLTVTIQGLPNITSNGSHGSWRAKAAATKMWKNLVYMAVGLKRPDTPLERAKITLTRHSMREPDYDNLAISFKPVIDGLKFAGVIVDDKRMNIGRAEYLWVQAPPKKGFITIHVEGING